MPSHPDESAALAIQTPAINDRSLAAGLAYAMGSRVTGMSFDPATGLMLGKVRGGAEVPYSTTAKLVRKGGGWSCTVGVCSCPVRKDCKHVAALLFAAEDNPATRVQLLAPAETSRLSRQPAALDLPDWEQALSPLIAGPGITQSTNGVPLALQFEIEEPAPHFSYTGRRDPLRSVRQLKARPVIMGAKGKWIRGDVSWNTLSYLNYRRECNEAHVEWMQEFLASHTAQANRQHAGTAPWLGLNTYAGKNLWSLLAEARKIGLALVHGKGDEPVRLAEEPAAVGLNLTRLGAEEADGGGLALAPTITVEGTVVDPASVGTIGRPAHGIFLTSDAGALPGVPAGDSGITLAPLEGGLSEELLTFVTGGTTLHIPARDEGRFLTGFYPKLKQTARVTASDDSVELPTLAVPTLSLLANYGADHRVRLHWEWHYKAGNLVTAQPLWRHPGDHGYRDDTAEARILETVGQPWDVVPKLGESATGGWGTPRLAATAELSGLDTLAFTEEVLPALRELREVSVDTAGEIADYREAEEAPVVSISTKATDQRDWFDLGIQISLEGQPVSFAAVFSALASGQTKMLLPSGAYFSLDLPELHQLRALIEEARELQDNKDAPLQISRFQAGLWDELAQLGIVDEQAAAWREAVGGLLEGGVKGLPLPATLNAELRPYQLEGFNWLSFLYRHGLGGVLADDMGLGKTLQTLAHLLMEKQAGRLDQPALAVMPTSLIPNWVDEARHFTPQLKVLALYGANRHTDFKKLKDYDLILTTYALLPRDVETLGNQLFHVLVLDEAQYIKNPTSKAAQAARRLNARQRLCLSGTPLENHLGELWSLFHFLMPGWLGDVKQFSSNYRTPIERLGDETRLQHLNARIKPFLLRRTKEQVATELPPKTEIIHWVELNDAQRDVYETMRLAMDKKVRDEITTKGVARSQIIILEALLKLRQVCCDLRLVKSAPASGRHSSSAKLESLMDMLEELLAENRKILLFSQFTSMLGLIEAELAQRGIEYALLTGQTKDRRTPVQDFQSGKRSIFLISLKAGGTGLNLTAADTVIHYDPWWNPAAENQATDRAYRIGQEKPVFVYKMIARGTVEEKIQHLQQEKSALASGVLDGRKAGDWKLQDDDIEALFAPLPLPPKKAKR